MLGLVASTHKTSTLILLAMTLCAKYIVMSLEISTTGFHICRNKKVLDGKIKFRLKEKGQHTSFQRQKIISVVSTRFVQA